MDDFSFPTIVTDQDSHCQLPFPHFAASPLWLFSSAKTEPEAAHTHRRNSSAAKEAAASEGPELSTRDSRDGRMQAEPRGDEERMDMLWEDFNEELHRVSHELRGRLNELGDSDQSDREQQGMMELCCVHALRETKNGSMIQHRKTRLILMLKVLKKLFLVHKANSSSIASVY